MTTEQMSQEVNTSRRWATCHQDLGGIFTVIGMDLRFDQVKGITEMEMKKVMKMRTSRNREMEDFRVLQ